MDCRHLGCHLLNIGQSQYVANVRAVVDDLGEKCWELFRGFLECRPQPTYAGDISEAVRHQLAEWRVFACGGQPFVETVFVSAFFFAAQRDFAGSRINVDQVGLRRRCPRFACFVAIAVDARVEGHASYYGRPKVRRAIYVERASRLDGRQLGHYSNPCPPKSVVEARNPDWGRVAGYSSGMVMNHRLCCITGTFSTSSVSKLIEPYDHGNRCRGWKLLPSARLFIIKFAMAPLSSVEVSMLRPNALLAGFIFLQASFGACRAGALQSPEVGAQTSPSAVEPNRASLVVELDRAIAVLKRGLKDDWGTRDLYLAAFEGTPRTDPMDRPVTDAKRYVECAMSARLRIHQIWDEGPPIEDEVQRLIDKFREWREGQGLARLPCFMPTTQAVIVSAGVAVSLLNTKIDPVYPAEALKNHVSCVVVLHATISAKGVVEALRIISGPALLQQAATVSARRWTYRPYLLNERPVGFEATINVVFAAIQ